MNGLATQQAGQGTAAQGEMPTYVPATDIFETNEALIMLLDMPGADPESLDVTLEGRELSVFASSRSSVPEGYALVHAEYRDGNYERHFVITGEVDGDNIDAVLTRGVLRLTVPKPPTAQPKKITVKAA
jgi:HSP20 family protein